MRSVGCGVVGTAVAGGVAAALGSARFERGRLGLAVGSAVSVTLALLLSGGRPVYGGLRVRAEPRGRATDQAQRIRVGVILSGTENSRATSATSISQCACGSRYLA